MTQPAPTSSPNVHDYGRQHTSAGVLNFLDRLTYASALGGALVMLALLLLLIAVIFHGAQPVISRFGWGFFTSTDWNPVKQRFGVLPAIYGTLSTSIVAMIISIPVSLGSAIFLVKLAPKFRIPIPQFGAAAKSRFLWVAPRQLVTVASFLIELLAAIPSIAYGLWGVFVLVPFMQSNIQPFLARTLGNLPLLGRFFQDTGTGYNVFTCGLILAIMVTPIMTAIIRDVLAVAPPELEQGALGLGATWWQATRLVLGFSKLGILGAVILGFARAIGETMAVTMVIGNTRDIDASLFGSGQSIASLLALQFREADTDTERQCLIYAAFVLLLITTLINGAARIMVMRVSRKAGKK